MQKERLEKTQQIAKDLTPQHGAPEFVKCLNYLAETQAMIIEHLMDRDKKVDETLQAVWDKSVGRGVAPVFKTEEGGK